MNRDTAILSKLSYEYKAIRSLGICILLRAAEDAFMTNIPMCQKKHARLFRDDAINFLTGKYPENLKDVCDLAGVAPETIIRESKKILDNNLSIKNFNELFNVRKNIK